MRQDNRDLIMRLTAVRLSDGLVEQFGFSSGVGARHGAVLYRPCPSDEKDQGGLLERTLFGRAGDFSANSVGYGSIKFINRDRGLDKLVTDYAIDGQLFEAWIGDERDPASWVPELVAIAERFSLDGESVTLTLLDRLAELQRPLCRSLLAGSNQNGEGVEGEAEQRDTPRPILYGRQPNLQPMLVNAARLIYLVCANAAEVTAVRHNGMPQPAQGRRLSLAALQTAEPSGGWAWYSGPEGTFIAVGFAVTGALTCDAATTEQRAAPLMQQVLLDAGVPATDIDAGDVAALALACPAPVGYLASSNETALDVLNRLAQSVGISCTPDRLNVYRMQRLSAPSGTAVCEVNDDNLLPDGFELVASGADDRGLPVRSIRLSYGHNPSVLNAPPAALVATDPAFASWVVVQNRWVVAESPTVAARHRLAVELQRETCLLERADAELECQRWLSLFGVPRRQFRLRVRFSKGIPAGLDLGAVIRLRVRELGMQDGWLGRVISIRPDRIEGDVVMRVWG